MMLTLPAAHGSLQMRSGEIGLAATACLTNRKGVRLADSKIARLYTLSDPRTGEVRYVGWTSKTPIERLSAHVKEAKRGGGSHKLHWVRELIAESLRPVIRTVAILDSDNEAKRLEVTYIAALRAAGRPLVNGTDGGDGTAGHHLSEEARAKIGAATRKQMANPAARARIGVANARRVISAESRAKMGAAHRDRPHSPEHRAHLAAAHRANPPGAKLTREQVFEIRARHILGEKGTILARDFMVSRGNISLICHGKTWKPEAT